jgi:hypothetical protein
VIDMTTAPAKGGARKIDEANFRELLAYVLPKPDEVKWQAIPWQTDLWAARRLGVAEHKPIFLWAMNGNPLGCT